jgi:hypothetical protein
VLLGIFIYWGWDTSLSVNEESEIGRGPGSPAVCRRSAALVYVVVSIAAQAYRDTAILQNNQTTFSAS